MSAPAEAPIEQAIDALHLHGHRRMLLAVSGGLDSSVLLDAAARRLPAGSLCVAHVDHGLHPDSADWAAHVRALAAKYGIGFVLRRLHAAPAAGESLEAWARDARYQALRSMGVETDCGAIVCAHHADDQLETLLIALTRGAGMRGLSAMRGAHPGELPVLRPLLGLARAQLEAYADSRSVVALEDPSNADASIVRNRLRRQAVPALLAALPGLQRGAMRSIEHLDVGSRLLEQFAREDLALAVHADGSLNAPVVQRHDPDRQCLLMRCWLTAMDWSMPSTARLADWRRQLLAPDAGPVRIDWRGQALCRYRDRVWTETEAEQWYGPMLALRWQGEAAMDLPGYRLRLRFVPGGAIDADWLASQLLRIRPARGQEQMRIAAGGRSRQIRKLWQEAGVPPWLRAGLPLVCVRDAILCSAAFGENQARPDASRLADDAVPAKSGLRLVFEPFRQQDPRRPWLHTAKPGAPA